MILRVALNDRNISLAKACIFCLVFAGNRCLPVEISRIARSSAGDELYIAYPLPANYEYQKLSRILSPGVGRNIQQRFLRHPFFFRKKYTIA